MGAKFAFGHTILIGIQKRIFMNLMNMYSVFPGNMQRYSMKKSIYYTLEMSFSFQKELPTMAEPPKEQEQSMLLAEKEYYSCFIAKSPFAKQGNAPV